MIRMKWKITKKCIINNPLDVKNNKSNVHCACMGFGFAIFCNKKLKMKNYFVAFFMTFALVPVASKNLRQFASDSEVFDQVKN